MCLFISSFYYWVACVFSACAGRSIIVECEHSERERTFRVEWANSIFIILQIFGVLPQRCTTKSNSFLAPKTDKRLCALFFLTLSLLFTQRLGNTISSELHSNVAIFGREKSHATAVKYLFADFIYLANLQKWNRSYIGVDVVPAK